MMIQGALDLLDEIEIYGTDTDLKEEVLSAIEARRTRIRKNGKVPSIELTELQTRCRFIKEASMTLEYELLAFVGATKRHGKDRVLE